MEMAIWHFYCITKAFLLHGLSFALYYIIATSPFNHKSVIMLQLQNLLKRQNIDIWEFSKKDSCLKYFLLSSLFVLELKCLKTNSKSHDIETLIIY